MTREKLVIRNKFSVTKKESRLQKLLEIRMRGERRWNATCKAAWRFALTLSGPTPIKAGELRPNVSCTYRASKNIYNYVR